MRLTVDWRGVLTALVFALALWMLITFKADVYVRVAIWGFIITTSILAVVRKFMRGTDGTYSMRHVVPDSLRRWMLDEHN